MAHVSADTVVASLEALASLPLTRSDRARLMGLLLLKATEPSRGKRFVLHATGGQSVEPQLSRFFRIAPETPRPDVNPFGRHAGRIEYLRPGYERRGTYTHLYGGRALDSLFDVTKTAKHISIRIPADATQRIASNLKAKAPLRATAAFLMRNEAFENSADPTDLIDHFKGVFRFSNKDVKALFEDDEYFLVSFSDDQFHNSLASLPEDLRPREPSSDDALRGRLQLRQAEAPNNVDLVIDDTVSRRIRNAVATSKAVALVGPPGTAKSALWAKVLRDAADEPSLLGFSTPVSYVCHTAEIDWTARTLIGAYYPNRHGELIFREGYMLQAIRDDNILWIDEMNRADLDRILGPILTFLAGQDVDLESTGLGGTNGKEEAKRIRLVWSNGSTSGMEEDQTHRYYQAGVDWRIVGTYNNVDRGRVFSMGSALMRRWATVPVPPIPADEMQRLALQVLPREPVASLLAEAYRLHLDHLPIGPAPFLDMARYVAAEGESGTGANLTDGESILLRDAYVLYMAQQLIRLDPDKREGFFVALAGIYGQKLADEAAAF